MPTWVTQEAAAHAMAVRKFRLTVQQGPDRGLTKTFGQPRVSIGARANNDLVVSDRRVSGSHAEIILETRGFRIRDVDSTNGTIVEGLRVNDGFLPLEANIAIGDTRLRFEVLGEVSALEYSQDSQFEGLIGSSPPMRRMFHELGRLANTTVTVLINGETGTGKELVAEAIHNASPRANGPLVVVDCGSIPANLLENELFGHERGAFTGADRSMAGAFERATGGTLFLDEIGELPLDQQPKLLRAIESRRVRRLGGTKEVECDLRIVAATNRDLAAEVNRGTFREDLFYRLAVARIYVPPLRERREDIMSLVRHFMTELTGSAWELEPSVRDRLVNHYWPGNVRELRNVVERLLVGTHALHLSGEQRKPEGDGLGEVTPVAMNVDIDVTKPFKEVKQAYVDEFDRRFVTALLERHKGNVTAAARAAQIDRVSLYKIMSRLGMQRP